MGRKKIDKNTIEYISQHLRYKDDVFGFQFTLGNTPLGIKENRPLTISCSINKNRSYVVIDCSEFDLCDKIEEEIFGMKDKEISVEQLGMLQQQFKDLGYEVDGAKFAGIWHWLIIKCTYLEIPQHVQKLKENIKID